MQKETTWCQKAEDDIQCTVAEITPASKKCVFAVFGEGDEITLACAGRKEELVGHIISAMLHNRGIGELLCEAVGVYSQIRSDATVS